MALSALIFGTMRHSSEQTTAAWPWAAAAPTRWGAALDGSEDECSASSTRPAQTRTTP